MNSVVATLAKLGPVLGLAILAGCGGSSSSAVTPPVNTPPSSPSPGPASGSEFFYQGSSTSDIQVSPLDSSTGVLGASTDAGDSFGENLGLAVATPSGKFLYVQGFYQFLAYNAVFCFSITGAGGQLTSLGPFPISAGTPNGIAMDGQGRFLYVSEYVGMVSDISGQQTNTIQAYSIDPGTEDLLEGPVLTSTSTTVGLLSAQAIDPDSRYLYTATGLSNGYAISVYAIDPVTATLTEVQGSPFFADSLTEGIGYSQRVFVSPR